MAIRVEEADDSFGLLKRLNQTVQQQAVKNRGSTRRPDLFVSVVLAHREYEAWFLSAAESLAGYRNPRKDLMAPVSADHIRDAKGWLSMQMPSSLRYSPTQDQAALTSQLDLDLARHRSRSFRKLWQEVEAIISAQ